MKWDKETFCQHFHKQCKVVDDCRIQMPNVLWMNQTFLSLITAISWYLKLWCKDNYTSVSHEWIRPSNQEICTQHRENEKMRTKKSVKAYTTGHEQICNFWSKLGGILWNHFFPELGNTALKKRQWSSFGLSRQGGGGSESSCYRASHKETTPTSAAIMSPWGSRGVRVSGDKCSPKLRQHLHQRSWGSCPGNFWQR